MKNNHIVYWLSLSLATAMFCHVGAKELADKNDLQGWHLSDEDLADPPPGEIRKMYLHALNDVRAEFSATIAAAPEGPAGKESPLMAKVQEIKADLDKIAKDRLQRDVFVLIPKIIALDTSTMDEEGDSQPTHFSVLNIALRELSVCIVHAIAEHVMDQEANVITPHLYLFVDTLSSHKFLSEHQWQEEIKPVDAAGIMIIDPVSVVTYLKTKPWRLAERFQFIWDQTIADPFARYQASGDGIPALKSKYTANKATINAKWNELKAWVKEQQAVDPNYTPPSKE